MPSFDIDRSYLMGGSFSYDYPNQLTNIITTEEYNDIIQQLNRSQSKKGIIVTSFLFALIIIFVVIITYFTSTFLTMGITVGVFVFVYFCIALGQYRAWRSNVEGACNLLNEKYSERGIEFQARAVVYGRESYMMVKVTYPSNPIIIQTENTTCNGGPLPPPTGPLPPPQPYIPSYRPPPSTNPPSAPPIAIPIDPVPVECFDIEIDK